MYFYDNNHEIENRPHTCPQLQENVIELIIDIFINQLLCKVLQEVKRVRGRWTYSNYDSSWCKFDQHVFNTLTTSHVGAICVYNACKERKCYIIVFYKSSTSHKIIYYYHCYDPLKYPLSFLMKKLVCTKGLKKL